MNKEFLGSNTYGIDKDNDFKVRKVQKTYRKRRLKAKNISGAKEVTISPTRVQKQVLNDKNFSSQWMKYTNISVNYREKRLKLQFTSMLANR